CSSSRRTPGSILILFCCSQEQSFRSPPGSGLLFGIAPKSNQKGLGARASLHYVVTMCVVKTCDFRHPSLSCLTRRRRAALPPRPSPRYVPKDKAPRRPALVYHRRKPFGKIKIAPTKALVTQRDLSLAYSPGVAAACEAIVEDPASVSELTARGNLVAVI